MRAPKHPYLPAAIALGVLMFVMVAAHGQASSGDQNVTPATAAKQAGEVTRGDPARWFKDDATPQARLHTLQKEIGAAYQEAQQACKHGPAPARPACLKDARTTYQHDMAGAREQVLANQ